MTAAMELVVVNLEAVANWLELVGEPDLAHKTGILAGAVGLRHRRRQLDAEVRSAGFDGFDGCPDDHCPTPYMCSEKGDCEQGPTDFDGSACAYWRRAFGVPGYADGTCSFGCMDEPACITSLWGDRWPGHDRLAAAVVGRLLG